MLYSEGIPIIYYGSEQVCHVCLQVSSIVRLGFESDLVISERGLRPLSDAGLAAVGDVALLSCLYGLWLRTQGFNGGNDPNNREPLWPTNFPESGELYDFLKLIIGFRKSAAVWNQPQVSPRRQHATGLSPIGPGHVATPTSWLCKWAHAP